MENSSLKIAFLKTNEFECWLDEELEKAPPLYRQPGNPFHSLFPRELEVLTSFGEGMSNYYIASPYASATRLMKAMSHPYCASSEWKIALKHLFTHSNVDEQNYSIPLCSLRSESCHHLKNNQRPHPSKILGI